MDTAAFVVMIHAGSTAAMCGLIWFVQVVHYPLFARVGATDFAAYEDRHTRRTTRVVAPLMLLEAVSAAALVIVVDSGWMRLAAWVGFALVGLIWVSTALIQVPCHRALVSTYDATTVRRLINTNWLRTSAWTLRTVIALALTAPGML